MYQQQKQENSSNLLYGNVGNSIFEYFLVMGVNIEDITYTSILDNSVVTQILDICPEFGTEKERPNFLDGLGMWCFPNGVKFYDADLNCLNIEQEEEEEENQVAYDQYSNYYAKLNPIHEKDIIFSFVTTDQNYTKRYCTCLQFYEKFFVPSKKKLLSSKFGGAGGSWQQEPFSKCFPKIQIQKILKNPLELDRNTEMIYVPKSICLVSKYPFFEPQRQVLTYLYHNYIMAKSNRNLRKSVPIPKKFFDQFNTLILKHANKETAEKNWPEAFQKGLNEYNLTEKQTDIQNQKNKNKQPQQQQQGHQKQIFKVKETHILEFYLSFFFSKLTLNSNSYTTQIYFPDENNNVYSPILEYKTSERITLTAMNFSYKSLYKKLKLVNIIKIIKYILLERQIILFSKNPGEIPSITEALLSFITPLTWSSIYIPFLTIDMWEQISAPMGYIIGFSSIHQDFILNQICKLLPADRKRIIIVDLDKTAEDEQIIADLDDGYKLPEKVKEYLINNMIKVLSEFKQSNSPNLDMEWQRTTLKSQKVFTNGMIQIINNYPIFFNQKTPSVEGQPAQQIFNFKLYLQLFTAEENQQFMKEFSQTMMFCKFIEDSYDELINKTVRSSEIQEFIEWLQFFKQYSQFQGGIVQTEQQKQNIRESYFIDFQQEQQQCQLLNDLQNFYIDLSIKRQKQVKHVSIMSDLIKWIKFLENYKLEKVIIKEKQKDTQKMKIMHALNHNIMYFSEQEAQKRLNRSQLTRDSQLFPFIDQRKIVNLNRVFCEKFDQFYSYSRRFSNFEFQNSISLAFESAQKEVIQSQAEEAANRSNNNTNSKGEQQIPISGLSKQTANVSSRKNLLTNYKYNIFLKRNRNCPQWQKFCQGLTPRKTNFNQKHSQISCIVPKKSSYYHSKNNNFSYSQFCGLSNAGSSADKQKSQKLIPEPVKRSDNDIDDEDNSNFLLAENENIARRSDRFKDLSTVNNNRFSRRSSIQPQNSESQIQINNLKPKRVIHGSLYRPRKSRDGDYFYEKDFQALKELYNSIQKVSHI